jgi:hypothetical protein
MAFGVERLEKGPRRTCCCPVTCRGGTPCPRLSGVQFRPRTRGHGLLLYKLRESPEDLAGNQTPSSRFIISRASGVNVSSALTLPRISSGVPNPAVNCRFSISAMNAGFVAA